MEKQSLELRRRLPQLTAGGVMVGAMPAWLSEPELVPESISHHPWREQGATEGQDPSPRQHGNHLQRCPLV